MSANKSSPTRKVEVYTTDNGTPFAYSMTSHKNIKVNAEVQPPLHLPGLIIFVHGVNSEGEWYNFAENALCDGLTIRLGLSEKSESLMLKPNKYYDPHWNDDDTVWVDPPRKIKEEGRSPVIRFYWGYRSADHETDRYAIPLKNKKGDNYYDLSPEERKTRGPWYWGGGPFQNGCNELVSLSKN
ncbi:T6SS effector phospholipase Tle3 domain-containing protein [Pseudescherichia vulneris]|uniref:T6SS effector phospholipase Tle3 domain-containing protein n=1 Tax=Pseudescherichia vulneris TaxID=566 RepID=UPI0030C9E4C7